MLRLIATRTRNQTRLISRAIAAGMKIGIAMNVISMNSRLMPRIQIAIIDTMTNPHLPPGIPVNQPVISCWPPNLSKTRAKNVDANRIISTRAVMSAVALPDPLITSHVRFRLRNARNAAPNAPTAPASVGEASPKKMLPRTAKMRKSGGTTAIIALRTNAHPS